jgi:FkbM family methyltransferase
MMEFKHFFDRLDRVIKQPERIKYKLDLLRIQNIPRYTEFQTNILPHSVKGVDSASFVFMFDEIFRKEIYKFISNNDEPFIIDCGANIGLSTIYFKKLFPKSRILAFEPDEHIFQILIWNILNFKFSNVELFNKAVWDSETTLEFMVEGADGGRIIESNSSNPCGYQVETLRINNFLGKTIDFLKLDIEGAETRVLQDCKDHLSNVKNLFIEYHSFVDAPQTLHLITQILFDAGFRIHLQPSFMSPHPFVKRCVSAGMDMQINIFAFREFA